MSLTKKGPKDNSKKKGVAAQQLAEKKIAALARQSEAAKRTPEEQLNRLEAGGFTATKERTKLVKRIEARSKKSSKR